MKLNNSNGGRNNFPERGEQPGSGTSNFNLRREDSFQVVEREAAKIEV